MNNIIRNRDYELLLGACFDLYEELRGTMEYFEILMNDTRIALNEIGESFENVDYRMDVCTRRFGNLAHREVRRTSDFQDTAEISAPEADAAAEPIRPMVQGQDFPSAS